MPSERFPLTFFFFFVFLLLSASASAFLSPAPAPGRSAELCARRAGVWGGLRRVLFRSKEDPLKYEAPKAVEEEVKKTKKKAQLSPSESTSLVRLGYSRTEAERLPPTLARNELIRLKVLEAPEPTDEELWQLARREVQDMEQFAKSLDPEEVERLRAKKQEDDEAYQAEVERTLAVGWPDLPKFTDLLKAEALFRLRILGPSFAEPLKSESRWRRDLYKGWLELLDGPGFLPEWNKPDLKDSNWYELDDRVHDVYDELLERRRSLRQARLQFESWEAKAAARKLVDRDDDEEGSSSSSSERTRWWRFWGDADGPPAALPPPPLPRQVRRRNKQKNIK